MKLSDDLIALADKTDMSRACTHKKAIDSKNSHRPTRACCQFGTAAQLLIPRLASSPERGVQILEIP
jgi:hypothetical protein